MHGTTKSFISCCIIVSVAIVVEQGEDTLLQSVTRDAMFVLRQHVNGVEAIERELVNV